MRSWREIKNLQAAEISSTVHYEGTLADTGDVFDSSRIDNAVFSFEIGAGTVIRAWETAIKTMKVGNWGLLGSILNEFLLDQGGRGSKNYLLGMKFTSARSLILL